MLGIELTPEHPVSRMEALGVAAEEAGYDTVFATSHYNNRDPFQVLSQIAHGTDEVRVGPGVANPHTTHPVELTSRVATLDESSDGRAIFGIGPGDPTTLRNLGISEEARGLRPVLETMKVAERLFDGERVTHDGAFSCEAAGLNYEPPTEVPIYVGGEGPHMCRMAAKHADGLLFNGSHPDDVAWAAKRVEEGFDQRPGAPPRETFDFAAYASVSVAEEREAAREAARPPVAFITAGAAPPVLERHGIDRELAEKIGENIRTGSFSEAFELVTPAMVDAFCMAGTEDEVAERMAAVLEYADSLVVGSPLGPDLETAIRLAARAAPAALSR